MMSSWKLAASAVVAVALAGCVQFPDMPGEARGEGASVSLSETPRFPDSLTDRAGHRWSPRVTDHYVSASGKECVRLDLVALGPAADLSPPRTHQVACRDGDDWKLARDFAAGGTVDPDLVFAPVADPALPKP